MPFLAISPIWDSSPDCLNSSVIIHSFKNPFCAMEYILQKIYNSVAGDILYRFPIYFYFFSNHVIGANDQESYTACTDNLPNQTLLSSACIGIGNRLMVAYVDVRVATRDEQLICLPPILAS